MTRDRAERQTLIDLQLAERRKLQHQLKELETRLEREIAELQIDPLVRPPQDLNFQDYRNREISRQPKPWLRL